MGKWLQRRTEKFEQKWKNKIPEQYRDWTKEEIAAAMREMYRELSTMSAENGYTFDDIIAGMEAHKDLITADEVMQEYLFKKEHRWF